MKCKFQDKGIVRTNRCVVGFVKRFEHLFVMRYISKLLLLLLCDRRNIWEDR